jgi:hypothetical protein
MKKQFQHLIFISTVVLFSINLSFGQSITGKSKVYSGKAKFLMTEINFKNFKAHKNCVGLIMFENVSKKTLNIAGVTKEFKSMAVTIKSQKIRPNAKGILTYTLINPSPGEFHSSSLIFFKEFNDPVEVAINGNFL